MRRRDFIRGFASSAGAWPLVARAQQGERVRRISVLINLAENDGDGQSRIAAFVEGLQRLGWTDGGNVRIEIRWGAGDTERYRRYAAELVAHAPDVLVPITSPAMAAVQQATRTVPIVFVGVIDPVGAGFVASLSRPGGNVTGFALFEYGISGKWLALLKEIAPDVTRAAVLRDTTIAAGTGQLGAIQALAPSLGMDLSLISLSDAEELERAISEFAHGANGGLIVTASPFGAVHPGLIATLAARYRLPTVYPFRYFVTAGGLISYGPDLMSPFRPAAGYVDRILRGEKPADLPVQTPTKYELALSFQ
jgi:putative ABC transport system substrate-binding protein